LRERCYLTGMEFNSRPTGCQRSSRPLHIDEGAERGCLVGCRARCQSALDASESRRVPSRGWSYYVGLSIYLFLVGLWVGVLEGVIESQILPHISNQTKSAKIDYLILSNLPFIVSSITTLLSTNSSLRSEKYTASCTHV